MKPSLDLPLGRIDSLTTSSGLSTGEVALRVGEDVVAVSRIVKGDVEPLAHAIRQAREAAPDEPRRRRSRAAGQVDPFEAMAKLSALRGTAGCSPRRSSRPRSRSSSTGSEGREVSTDG